MGVALEGNKCILIVEGFLLFWHKRPFVLLSLARRHPFKNIVHIFTRVGTQETYIFLVAKYIIKNVKVLNLLTYIK